MSEDELKEPEISQQEASNENEIEEPSSGNSSEAVDEILGNLLTQYIEDTYLGR
jgi:hypothetical protein